MYNASVDYKAKAGDAVRYVQQIRGKVIRGSTETAFDNEDVILNSFSLTNQICASTEIELGGVYIGQLSLIFTKAFASSIGRGNWAGTRLNIELGLILDDDSVEYIPAPSFAFTVDSATWLAEGLQVVAYDDMVKLDKNFTADTSSGTVFNWLTYIGTTCGVPVGMSQAEAEALPNGAYNMALFNTNGLITFRDVLRQLASACGCFATMDRTGALVLVPLTASEPVDTISAPHRFAGPAFSDFETYYTGLYVVDEETKEARYYHADGVADDGLTISIGSNPFLQYGTANVKERMRQNIIDSFAGFRATPFKASILGAAHYDLGDLIKFTGGIGAGSNGCIMFYSISCGTLSAEGYGENPALATAQSKVDKEISGLISTSKTQGITYYTYTNVSPGTIAEGEEERVANFRFATKETTTVTLWHEFKLDVELEDEDTPAVLTAHYYLNGVEETYSPAITIGESGLHTVDWNYFLRDISGGSTNTWTVTLELEGATAEIGAGDTHVCLSGQGLVSNDAFLGYIDASDDFTALTIAGINVSAFTETVVLDRIQNSASTGSDNISDYELPGLDVEITENPPTLVVLYNDNHISYCGEGMYCGSDFNTCGENILA